MPDEDRVRLARFAPAGRLPGGMSGYADLPPRWPVPVPNPRRRLTPRAQETDIHNYRDIGNRAEAGGVLGSAEDLSASLKE